MVSASEDLVMEQDPVTSVCRPKGFDRGSNQLSDIRHVDVMYGRVAHNLWRGSLEKLKKLTTASSVKLESDNDHSRAIEGE